MNARAAVIPVVLFAHARPVHTARVLACLRANRVPLIIAFADGARQPAEAPAVAETRALLREIDWCEVRLTERAENRGLGRSILEGVTQVAAEYPAFIVWEDDLVCVPGTYDWLCAALRHYADEPRVMSVTAWTHPRVIPANVGESPYCDGRAECWVWGAWARSWVDMATETAAEKMAATARAGLAVDAYGADLPVMAAKEQAQNIWAVRWLYHHLQRRGLCVRPPWSMVEHIGFDPSATNAAAATRWANPALRSAPPVPTAWPAPVEHAVVRSLWHAANPSETGLAGWSRRGWNWLRRRAGQVRRRGLRLGRRQWFRGDYARWSDARSASAGYDDRAVLARVVAATREVAAGRALWERDGVAFINAEINAPLLAALGTCAAGGRLDVVDFGGALGSTWWQHRPELARLGAVRWCVVEQPHYLAAGAEFVSAQLGFADSLAAAARERPGATVVFSSVLPYVEDPAGLLAQAVQLGFRDVIIDRTPFIAGGRTRLAVQHTPPGLGGGSYPCWLFDEAALLAPLREHYVQVASWPALDRLDPDVEHRGFHFRRK